MPQCVYRTMRGNGFDKDEPEDGKVVVSLRVSTTSGGMIIGESPIAQVLVLDDD